MPKITPIAWWCWRGHKNGPQQRVCTTCGHPHYERHAQVHSTERAVVYVNPATGERRTPARADVPLPDMYRSQGFERQEIMNMSEWERQTGLIHEATNYNSGNGPPPVDPNPAPKQSPEAKQALIDDIRAAIASGPFTGGL